MKLGINIPICDYVMRLAPYDFSVLESRGGGVSGRGEGCILGMNLVQVAVVPPNTHPIMYTGI